MPETEKPADLTGRTLGDFAVLRKIGAGGMGQVYLARQLSLKREVALKLLRDDLAANDKALQRFQAEAEAVARISHPNIVQVYAIGEAEGLRFMALEYVSGRNLRDYLGRKGPPELPVALAIMKQVAAALQKASELGIVHRDVKPENILLTKKVEVKVTDFGLSRLTAQDAIPLNLTQSGVTLGTPLYMAPEQVQGKPTDHRSDLYSFGVTCYHLLAGHAPFSGATAYEVAMKHVTEEPEPLAAIRPDLPADLVALVHKLLAKEPEQRYANARDVLRDLNRIGKGEPVATSIPWYAEATQAVGAATQMGSMTLGSGPVPSGATISLTAPPSRWPARILAGLGVLVLFGVGWAASGVRTPKEEPPPPNMPGLADYKVPESLTPMTGRERDLLAKLENRQTPAAEFLNASIELGLLYVKERKFEKAKKVFDDLEKEKPEARTALPKQLLAAKFGQGIVLAHQDKVEESIKSFTDAVALPRGPAALPMNKFLIDHPDLSVAIAEALQRDQDNLPKGKKLPPNIEWLRSPSTLIRGKN